LTIPNTIIPTLLALIAALLLLFQSFFEQTCGSWWHFVFVFVSTICYDVNMNYISETLKV
jgi:hypothetical protein